MGIFISGNGLKNLTLGWHVDYLTYNYRLSNIEYCFKRLNWPVIKAKDTRTSSMVCDFKDKSSTFNGNVITIPNVGQIPVLMNPKTSSTRDAGLESPIIHEASAVCIEWYDLSYSQCVTFWDSTFKGTPKLINSFGDFNEGVNNLIKFAVNHWRITGSRVTNVSDIMKYIDANIEVSRQLPKCPWIDNKNQSLYIFNI